MWCLDIGKKVTEVTCPILLVIYNALLTICVSRDKNSLIVAVYYSVTMTLFSLMMRRISYKDTFLMIFMYAILFLPLGTLLMIRDCDMFDKCSFLIGMYTFHLIAHAAAQVNNMRRALVATPRDDNLNNV